MIILNIMNQSSILPGCSMHLNKVSLYKKVTTVFHFTCSCFSAAMLLRRMKHLIQNSSSLLHNFCIRKCFSRFLSTMLIYAKLRMGDLSDDFLPVQKLDLLRVGRRRKWWKRQYWRHPHRLANKSNGPIEMAR